MQILFEVSLNCFRLNRGHQRSKFSHILIQIYQSHAINFKRQFLVCTEYFVDDMRRYRQSETHRVFIKFKPMQIVFGHDNQGFIRKLSRFFIKNKFRSICRPANALYKVCNLPYTGWFWRVSNSDLPENKRLSIQIYPEMLSNLHTPWAIQYKALPIVSVI